MSIQITGFITYGEAADIMQKNPTYIGFLLNRYKTFTLRGQVKITTRFSLAFETVIVVTIPGT